MKPLLKHQVPRLTLLLEYFVLNYLLGEAEYLYDIPDHPHQLFAAFVLANTKPRSIVKKVDPSKALVRMHLYILYMTMI